MTVPLPAPLQRRLTYSRNWLADQWLARSDYDPFDLNAPYQRGSVWSVDQRRALIRSLLLGVPVGTATVAELPFEGTHSTAPGTFYRVVDGKQRVETLRMFASDGFTVPGWWWDQRRLKPSVSRAHEVVYSDFSGIPLSRFVFPATVFRSYQTDDEDLTPAETLAVEQEVFDLINTAGTPQ